MLSIKPGDDKQQYKIKNHEHLKKKLKNQKNINDYYEC